MRENAKVENASLAELRQALAERPHHARGADPRLSRPHRGLRPGRAGAQLRARDQSRRAGGIAASYDAIKPSPRMPLAGIPILIKDNIATGDGSTRRPGRWRWRARAARDATVVARLRAAGAVILGKANLTEFANIMAIDMPSGYSSLGGQVQEPLRAGARRQGRADRLAGRVELGFGGRRRGRAVRRRRSAPRPRARCCRRRRRTGSSRSSRPSG